MDKITHEVRIANWRSIIEQCHARPEGQSAKQWLADNGISEKNYYYWQRKIRQETYALISSDAAPIAQPGPVAFAELPFIVGAIGIAADLVIWTLLDSRKSH